MPTSVTDWDEQSKYGNKNSRAVGEKERNFALGERNCPGDLRGKIVATAAGQNPERCPEKRFDRSFLGLRLNMASRFAIQFSFMFCTDHTLFTSERPPSSPNRKLGPGPPLSQRQMKPCRSASVRQAEAVMDQMMVTQFIRNSSNIAWQTDPPDSNHKFHRFNVHSWALVMV